MKVFLGKGVSEETRQDVKHSGACLTSNLWLPQLVNDNNQLGWQPALPRALATVMVSSNLKKPGLLMRFQAFLVGGPETSACSWMARLRCKHDASLSCHSMRSITCPLFFKKKGHRGAFLNFQNLGHIWQVQLQCHRGHWSYEAVLPASQGMLQS